MLNSLSFDLSTLRAGYLSNAFDPESVIAEACARIESNARDGIWISRLNRDEAQRTAAALRGRDPRTLPLFGIPFAVKDNIDVAGFPTTAACPAFARAAPESAAVVQRLIDAGAICLGKTNMDQFAAGLVGTRSPYGACQNAFRPDYISGGSSSGSAVAVALGQVSFALGTDTAGSGRVPAAFNNLVGYKPSRGLLSTHGVVPACRSLDCVSVFSLTVADAERIAAVSTAFDARAFGSRKPSGKKSAKPPNELRCGIPRADQLRFFGDAEYERLFGEALERLKVCGVRVTEIDFAPFQQAADLLYGGPWVAERYAAIKPFFDMRAEDVFPVTRFIIERGREVSGAEVFEGLARLDALRTQAESAWESIDVLALPTAGTIYTHAEVADQPIELNTRLGYYTNFVNLLDCSALALPGGFRADGLPFGVTLVAPALHDATLFALGADYHGKLGGTVGATPAALSSMPVEATALQAAPGKSIVQLAVVGAHLSGQPLNHELTRVNARLLSACRTGPIYRLHALATTPLKPGLVQVVDGTGVAIEVEVWELSAEGFGLFVANVPPPMTIGSVKLDSNQWVKGFLCEPYALSGAREISEFGGWRNFLRSLKA